MASAIPRVEYKEKELMERIDALRKRNGASRYERELNEIRQKAKEVTQLNDDDRKRKEDEIEKLKRRVSELEKELIELKAEVIELKEKAQVADAIDAGEAMKIVENHLAKFVLPDSKKIGFNALQSMLEYLKTDNHAKKIWRDLTQNCKMKNWTKKHTTVKNVLIQYRNNAAHHEKFSFEAMKEAMIENMPDHREQCEDIVRLFITVDHLMKFGIIASEFMENEARSDSCPQKSKELMCAANIWDKRDIQNLQDIQLDEAKEHVEQYFPNLVGKSIWSKTVGLILNTNRPRFYQLAINTEKKLLEDISKYLVQKPKTLWSLIKMSRMHTNWNEETTEKLQERWRQATAKIWWTQSHDEALEAMKGTDKRKEKKPDKRQEDKPDEIQEDKPGSKKIDPLPLRVAKLHVPDFIKNGELWKECSDIFKIFEKGKELFPT